MSKLKDNKVLETKKISRSIFFPESEIYDEIRRRSFNFLKYNGYSEIIIPTYDYKSTFQSSLGEETDIIQKEMFIFFDKKNRELALRPEGTACVANSVIANNKIKKNLKLFYWSNMFRYERPQKGRYREFWQLGVEFINSSKFSSDCEILFLSSSLIKKIGVDNCTIFINYLGNDDTKRKYSFALRNSLKKIFDSLCILCKKRYEENPLRIVDCEKCGKLKEILYYKDFLSEFEVNYFEKLKNFLLKMNIKFCVDEKLVRGISYYNGLVFEIKENRFDKSILGGGRYDGLMKNNEKKSIEKSYQSVGFAVGIDRIVDFYKLEDIREFVSKNKTFIVFACFSEESFLQCFLIKEEMYKKNEIIRIEIIFVENKSDLKIVKNIDPFFSSFFGDKEIKKGVFPIKNHIENKIFSVNRENLVDWLIEEFKRKNI